MKADYELIVIGGGPAGLAAALSAYENGLKHVLVVERDRDLGGILNQCIHNGFGLHYFGQELTGPEYAERFIDKVHATDISLCLDTMVLNIKDEGSVKRVTMMSEAEGYRVVSASAIVLAMGCRERSRGAIQTPGTRPSGILTAGTAQRYINIEGYQVGRRVLILGSGDIGLIMARRLTLEGAKVLACVEIQPFSGGLNRNIVQCLEDYDIPLYLSHSVTKIEGKGRLKRVCVQAVDDQLHPIEGTEQYYDVDTLLLSVGLIPENELSRAAGIPIDPRTQGPIVNQSCSSRIPGIFACGNVLHVHDLVDFVSEEGQRAGLSAAQYVKAQLRSSENCIASAPQSHSRSGSNPSFSAAPFNRIQLLNDPHSVAYTVPQDLDLKDTDTEDEQRIRIFFRVRKNYRNPAYVVLLDGDRVLHRFKKPYMAPGEMQNILLPSGWHKNIRSMSLTLSIQEINQEVRK